MKFYSVMKTLLITLFVVSIVFANGVLQDVQTKMDEGNYQAALDLIKPYVEENPELPQALILAGKIYYQLGYINEAKDLVDKAINLDRANQEYRDFRNEMASFVTQVTEASRSKNDGKYTEAKDKFAELLKLNPNFAEGYFMYAQVLFQLDDAKNGSIALKKAMELRPEEEKYNQAYAMYGQKFLADGNALLERRDYLRATKKFQQALILDPGQYLAYYLLARAYSEEKNYEDALLALDKCISIKDDYIKAYVVKGNIFIKTNKLNDAIATFTKITEIDRGYYAAWDKIGYINYTKKDYDAAIPAYNQAIKLDPEKSKPYENLGVIYSEKKDWDNAITNLKKASELNTKEETIWYRLAAAYNAKGDAQNAKDAADKALTVKPNWAAAQYELGIAERRLGNLDQAKNAFRMAAKDPKWKKAAEFELNSGN
ncbi:MAG: tetratricopeptide repeat protein [Candidatus Marinimicrobia bacterium]|nr:tetratricopeptide repeat protein [Candidatus Neomarinimicrobiota bacterium]